MINEYAVDPAIISSWERLQRLLAQFGFDKHRLIARVPGKWRMAVCDSFPESLSDIERSRIVDKLRDFERLAMIPRKHTWHPGSDWLENVSRIHALKAFALILTSEGTDVRPPIVSYSELDETNPPVGWLASGRVERTRDEMVKALHLVLETAERIVKIVDPYFHPCSPRFLNPFVAYMTCICRRHPDCELPQIELHTSDKHDGHAFQEQCKQRLASHIPKGFSLRIVRWPAHRLHNRYVLTEKACVFLGTGTDENEKGSAGVDFDSFKLLNAREGQEITDEYDSKKSRFGEPDKRKQNDFAVDGTL